MNDIAALKKTDHIRLLNDNLRSTFVGGKVMLTSGVDALPAEMKAAIVLDSLLKCQRLQGFDG